MDDRLDARAAPVPVSFAIDLRDKVVLLTGGSSGIGAATVRGLHAAGAAVFFTFLHHEQRAQELAAALGSRVKFAPCDVGDHSALPALIDRCLDEFKQIHVLVNNAAVFEENSFEQTDYASWRAGWQKTFDINLFGAAHLAWLIMHQMRRQGSGGRIVNVVSRAGHRGELSFADYGASKAALINFTKSVARADRSRNPARLRGEAARGGRHRCFRCIAAGNVRQWRYDRCQRWLVRALAARTAHADGGFPPILLTYPLLARAP